MRKVNNPYTGLLYAGLYLRKGAGYMALAVLVNCIPFDFLPAGINP